MSAGTARCPPLGATSVRGLFTVLPIAAGRRDGALLIFAAPTWIAARGLRMRVELSGPSLRHVGFLRTREIDAAAVARVEAHAR